MFLATFVLFFVLTPGVILSLPPKGSKIVTALVHALLFAVLLTLFMECFKMNYQEGNGAYGKIHADCEDPNSSLGDCTGRIKPTNILSNL